MRSYLKPLLGLLAFLLPVSLGLFATTPPESVTGTRPGFLLNQGQWPSHDLYRVQASGFLVAFMQDGVRFCSSMEIEEEEHQEEAHQEGFEQMPHKEDEEARAYYVWKMSFTSGNDSAKIFHQDLVASRTNFFLGSDPLNWQQAVPEFKEVVYEEVWPGIDIHFFLTGKGQLKYEFRLDKGADPDQIEVAFEGLEGIEILENGQLKLLHPWHEIVEEAPEAWVDKEGRGRDVSVSFRRATENSYGFRVNGSLPEGEQWTIDPLVQHWGSYTYATGYANYALDVGHDNLGRLYMVGFADATFPTTTGVVQPTYGGGLYDGFLCRFSADGTNIEFTTYIGGGNYERVLGLSVMGNDTIFMTGYSESSNFPSTSNLGSNLGGDQSPWVAALTNNGSNLIYSSYLCSSCIGRGIDIEAVSGGEVILTGILNSSLTNPIGFPTTPQAFMSTAQGTVSGWISRINATGTAFQWSTLLTGDNVDWINCMVVNDQEEPIVGGFSSSTNFPTTANAYQTAQIGNSTGFLAHFDANGANLIASTLFGANVSVEAVDIHPATQNLFIAGLYNANFATPILPITSGAYQSLPLGFLDGYAAKFDPSLSSLTYSTFLGGSGAEFVHDIAVNQAGEAYVSGYTHSFDFPISSCQLQSSKTGGSDVFLVHLNSNGTGLSTGGSALFGGSNSDYNNHRISLREDGLNDTLFTVLTTHSNDFPVTPLAFQTVKPNGTDDIQVAHKLVVFEPIIEDTSNCLADSILISGNIPFQATNILWSTNDTSPSTWIQQGGDYWVTYDVYGCNYTDTFTVTLDGFTVDLGEDTTYCSSNPLNITLAPNTGSAWSWSNGQAGPSINVNSPGSYWVVATDTATGCTGTDTIHIGLQSGPEPSIPSPAFCEGETVTIQADPGNQFPGASVLWSNGDTLAQSDFGTGGWIWVELTDADGCSGRDSAFLTTLPNPMVNLGPDTSLCRIEGFNLAAPSGFSTYLWSNGDSLPSVAISQPGPIWVEVVDANGCIARDTIEISEQPLPVPSIGSDTLVCEPASSLLLAVQPNGFGNYLWSTGETTEEITVQEPGTYSVVVSNQPGCEDSARVTVEFGELPSPELGPDRDICRQDDATMSLAPVPGTSILWWDGNTEWNTTPERSGTYWVQLTNECGSVRDSITLRFATEEDSLFLPNVFSPNGDGINDCFRIETVQPEEFLVEVYDRWGRLIYGSRDIDACWNGFFQGKEAPESVYTVLVQFRGCSGKLQVRSGTLTLLR